MPTDVREGTGPHWDDVWGSGEPAGKSWYQRRPDRSLALIAGTGTPRPAPLVDVGAGASNLVDHLLAAGWHDLTVLDVAAPAIATARRRLGRRADHVSWIAADVLEWRPDRAYALWHDRALFHFLTVEADRERYRAVLRRALRPGGHAIVATFAADGPDRCSGLPVVGYAPETLAAAFSGVLEPLDFEREEHRTPTGGVQPFLYGRFRRPEATSD